MAIRDHQVSQEKEDHHNVDGESGSEECGFDDSDEDPTFDIMEETRSGFSKLSLKKCKSRVSKEIKNGSDEEQESVEVPKLSKEELKSFESVEKLLQAGQLEKLKVDQCKVYLRKYGLRLTGNKDVLIERIGEHLGVIDGGGEKKYPISSFELNCKGDACTRDVVMFEQNVYEMFSIASRSATGPPCGTRIAAGRIVKESYGAAKQQHTFTIEVLWSKGERPLPPLHPLLIKGRNLYRLKTMRQRWADEEERRKVLLEKHSRGSIARCSREARIQDKEMRKMGKNNRIKSDHENQQQQHQHHLAKSDGFQQPENPQHNQQQQQQKQQEGVPQVQKEAQIFPNIGGWQQLQQFPRRNHQCPPLLPLPAAHEFPQRMNSTYRSGSSQRRQGSPLPTAHGFPQRKNSTYLSRSPQRRPGSPPPHVFPQRMSSTYRSGSQQRRPGSPLPTAHGFAHRKPLTNSNSIYQSGSVQWRPGSPQWPMQRKKPCRFYARGHCYHGNACNYLHE